MTTYGDDVHPRVRHARHVRRHVTVHAGATLLRHALALVPDGEPLFAAVAPGNARSLRASLRAGLVPLGSEAHLVP